MHYQRTPSAGGLSSAAQTKSTGITTLLKNGFPIFGLLLTMMIVPSAMAQSAFIRFGLTQNRITVPVNNPADSVSITNISVNLGNGAASANLNVSGLPAGASYVLTDTNGGTPLTSITSDTNITLTVNTANLAEGLYPFRLNAGGLDTNGLPVTNSFPFTLQVAHIWAGTLNGSNSWSDAGSWSNGLPSATSDVVFGDAGAQTNGFGDSSGIPWTNSFVTADTIVGSMRFSQTGFTNDTAITPPIYHHLQIAQGKTLTLAGTNGLSLLTDYFDEGNAGLRPMNVTIDGAGGKLVVSNLNANFSILQGASLVPTLNMSNLDTFIAKVGRIGIEDYQVYPGYRDLNTALNVGHDTNNYSGRPRQLTANFFAAKTNIFFSGFIDPSNYTNEVTRGYGFTVNDNEQQGVGSGTSQTVLLGTSNLFFVDGICFYGTSGNGTTKFGPTNGSAIFRNTNGTSRVSVFTVSDDGGTNGAVSNIKGILDLSQGTVNALVDRLYMSRDREQIATNQTPNIQSDLIVGKGTFDANTAILGFQEHTKPDWTVLSGGQPYLNYCQGRLLVTNGGTFRVNGTITLGYTADTNNPADAEQYNTYGRITIASNSVVAASNIVVDTGLNFYDANGRQNSISINTGGNLVVSNTIGGPDYIGAQYPTFGDNGGAGLPLDSLSMQSGAVLTLFVTPGKTNIYVRNFSSSGIAPGIIKIASLPTFPVYPTNISLIAYSTATPVLAADMSAISGNVQGYILNNSANSTIDLFLTTNAPRSLVWTGGVNNQWDLHTANWAPLGGGAATAFSMGDIAIFNDTTSVTNIDIVDTVVPNQQTNGVIINNSARIFTFNSAGGSIAGTAKLVKQGTNDLNFNAIEAGPALIMGGNVNVAGSMGTATIMSNTVLNVTSGGSVAGVNATNSTVNVQGGSINGAVSLIASVLVNDGFLNIPSGTRALSVDGNSIATNNADGNINISGTSNPGAEVFAGGVMANFGTFTVGGARMTIDGTYFGTGLFYDNVNQSTSGSFGRLQMSNTPGALMSPGATPTNSIGNFLAGVRLDLSGNNPQNTAPTFWVDVDAANNLYDTVTAVRWNNINCIWQMNLVNGAFHSGQVFQILVNANGTSVPNFVDTPSIYPLVQPTVPGPGLQWNLTGIREFGTVSVTNSAMVWDGSGNGSWDTNGSTGNWKSANVYSDNQGAIFDDTASGSTTITLNSLVAPAGFNITTNTTIVGTTTNFTYITNTPSFSPGIVVSNALKDYTITTSDPTNRITGMTSIYKTGPGTLTLLSSNDFTGGMVVEGGTVAFTNTAALGASSGNTRAVYDQIMINDATLKYIASATNQNLGHPITVNSGGATFEVSSNDTTLAFNATANGAGALTKTGAGILSLTQNGDAYSGGTVVNAGTLRLTAAAAGSGAVTLNNGATLELTNSFTLTNTVNIAGNGTTILLSGTNTSVLTGPLTGSGSTTANSTNANRMLVFNNDLTGFSGTISFGSSIGQFRFNNRTNDSPTTGSAAATFDLGSGSATLFNVSRTNQTYDLGALAGGANTTLSGSATNGGAASTTYSIGANGANTTFAGKIVDGQDVVSVNKVGTGKLALDGANTYTGTTTVSGGTLAGNGSIAGPLTVQASGTLSPGDPVGTFTVNNNATLAGSVVMNLQSLQNSKLSVTGTITATGPLVVTNIGPDIANGTKFVLFNKAVSGFSSTTLPASNPTHTSTYTWQNDIATDGSITLVSGGGTSTVNTNPTNIVVSVSGNQITLSWPADHLGWELLTNAVGLTATNQWFPITGSTATTQEILTFDKSKTNGVYFRMVYPPLP